MKQSTNQYHLNLNVAFLAANPPCGIAYARGKGWYAYDLTEGTTEGIPEFIFHKRGQLPTPLTELASEALASLIAEGLQHHDTR